MKMHESEASISIPVVGRLLASQASQYSHLPIRSIDTAGTVNDVYRLGERLVVRLPRLEGGINDLEKEALWLPKLLPCLPLTIPVPVFLGDPSSEYPHRWAIYSWIDGSQYLPDGAPERDVETASDIARFVAALRNIDTTEAPRAGRRPLRELDTATRAAIDASYEVDQAGALTAWKRALTARPWSGHPVWIHSDLLPTNLLTQNGRLAAVIDWGSSGIGDPAHDIIPAWAVLRTAGRRKFRALLDDDDDVWERARGIALHQALVGIPYYRLSNPDFSEMCQRTIAEILTDDASR